MVNQTLEKSLFYLQSSALLYLASVPSFEYEVVLLPSYFNCLVAS